MEFYKSKELILNEINNGKIQLHQFCDNDINERYKNGFIFSLVADKTSESFKGPPILASTSVKAFQEDIINNKKELIDFAINNPELSYDILYWLIRYKTITPRDFKDYNEEQISKIPPAILYSIINPDEAYKIILKHGINSSIFHFLPRDEKKWEALEWVASNEPSKLNLFLSQHKNNPFTKQEILKHYKNKDISKLPDALQHQIKRTPTYMPQNIIDKQAKSLLSKAINSKTIKPYHYENKQIDLAYRDYFLNALAIDKTNDNFDRTKINDAEYFGEKLLYDILENKQALIDFSINNPEYSYNVLYWLICFSAISPKDLSAYSEEQVSKIPQTILHTIQHPDEAYKMFTKHKVDTTLFYYIPKDERKWEALEWIASNSPSKLEIFFSKKELCPYKTKELLNHYQDIDIDKIPEALQPYIQNIRKEQSEIEQRKDESKAIKEKLWLDKSGKLQQFFKINDGTLAIKKIEDYVKIINHFVKSGLPASKFCKEYRIDNVEGFRKLCKKYAETNAEFAEYYTNNSEQQSKKSFVEINAQINAIARKKTSLEQFTNCKDKDDESVLNFKDMITAGKDNQNLSNFVNKTIEYYYSRLNSYSPSSFDVENLTKSLSFSELRFLIPDLADKQNKLSDAQFDVEFKKLLTQIKEANLLDQHTKKLVYDKDNGILSNLKQYNKNYRPSKYINITYEMNGQKITITKDIIDSAVEFALNHNLYVCSNIMYNIIMSVALGSVQKTNEPSKLNEIKARKELEANILEKIKQCKTLEEFFKQIDSVRNFND